MTGPLSFDIQLALKGFVDLGESMKDNNLSLYGITEEMDAFGEILEMDQGEFNEDSEVLLQSIEDALTLKTDNVVGYIEKEEDLVNIAKAKIKELQDFKKSKENKIQRFKDYVKMCIEKTGQEKFTGTLNSIKLRKPIKVVFISNEDNLPPQYFASKTSITIDKTQIKTDLKNGVEIEGAELVDGAAGIIVGLNKGK